MSISWYQDCSWNHNTTMVLYAQILVTDKILVAIEERRTLRPAVWLELIYCLEKILSCNTITHHLCSCSMITTCHGQARSPVNSHDDAIKWKYFPRYWPFTRGIHRSPVNSPHKGQWRGALMYSLICAWINDSANNREAGDLRRHRVHYDVIIMRNGQQFGSLMFSLLLA